MGTLIFVCPANGEEVSTGIEMDVATLNQLYLSKIYCPHCRQPHQMAGLDYWLTYDDELRWKGRERHKETAPNGFNAASGRGSWGRFFCRTGCGLEV